MPNEEQLSPTAAAESMEQFRAARKSEPSQADVQPVEEVAAPETSEQPEGASETETVAETVIPQEPKKKRDHSAEGRISDLTARAKAAEVERDDYRTKWEASQAPKPAAIEAPKPAAAIPDDPEPKQSDEAYQAENGYEKFLRAASRWDLRQEQRQTEQQRQKQAEHQNIAGKITAARAKFADFDSVLTLVPTAPMLEFLKEFDSGADVMYYLGKNPAEYNRIAALSNARQLAELGKLEDKLSTPAPEQPKPQPVSRAAAPPRTIGGTEAPAPRPLAEAQDMNEFRRLRQGSHRR
jgi:hypothetical protein